MFLTKIDLRTFVTPKHIYISGSTVLRSCSFCNFEKHAQENLFEMQINSNHKTHILSYLCNLANAIRGQDHECSVLFKFFLACVR